MKNWTAVTSLAFYSL